MKILVVEDDPCDSYIINHLFSREHEVVFAKTGAEALQLLDDSFDLILCDVGLPDATNLESGLTTTIKILETKGVKLIAISSVEQPGVVSKEVTSLRQAVNESS